MSLFFSNKAVRLLLSVSVSIWMAGGCLFGCTTGVMGAERAQEDSVVAGASCHATSEPDGLAASVSGPRGIMENCPLGVNATAAISKSSAHMPEPGLEPVCALPDFEKQTLHPQYTHVVAFLHNRGSTHLQYCVFLI